MLKAIKITREFKELKKLISLNKEAFPKNERLEVDEILNMTKHKEVDFVAIYDGNIFVGYYLIFKNNILAYIYFLAVDKDLRGKGYGSKIIKFMEDYYRNYTIILDLEEIDENADNNFWRKKRKDFYLKNGYKECFYGMAYVGMRFEILVYKKNFNIEEYKYLIETTKDIINNNANNKFEPTFFKL